MNIATTLLFGRQADNRRLRAAGEGDELLLAASIGGVSTVTVAGLAVVLAT